MKNWFYLCLLLFSSMMMMGSSKGREMSLDILGRNFLRANIQSGQAEGQEKCYFVTFSSVLHNVSIGTPVHPCRLDVSTTLTTFQPFFDGISLKIGEEGKDFPNTYVVSDLKLHTTSLIAALVSDRDIQESRSILKRFEACFKTHPEGALFFTNIDEKKVKDQFYATACQENITAALQELEKIHTARRIYRLCICRDLAITGIISGFAWLLLFRQ
jgi:hypothetical protein